MSDKMRERFESWIAERPLVKKWGAKLHRRSDGVEYKDVRVQEQWMAWKAALAEQPGQGEAVAWGIPNTAITGKRMSLMMVRLDIPSDDQYGGAMWVPLYTAPPAPSVPDGWKLAAYRPEFETCESHCKCGVCGTTFGAAPEVPRG